MRLTHSLYAFALVAVLPVAAQAQACIGLPLQTGQTAVAVGVGFPDNASSYGISGTTRASDQLSLSGSYSYASYDDDLGDIPGQHDVGVQGAYELRLSAAEGGQALSVCPVVGLGYTSWDEVSVFSVPVGAGIGTTFPLADGAASLTPYVVPQLVWARASMDGVDSESDTEFGFTAGANALLTRYFAGAGIRKVGDADAVFSIQIGLVF